MTRDELENNLLAGGATSTLAAGAGIIGGQRAKKADLDKLETAQKMEKQGADPFDIEQKTGWYRSPDGEWKWRISDAGAEFKVPVLDPKAGALLRAAPFEGQVGQVLQHPNLYENYPELQHLPYSQYDMGPKTAGSAIPGLGMIDINTSFGASQAPEVLTHELQHVIQGLEGAGIGGNEGSVGEFFSEPSMADPKQMAGASELYTRLAGEVEARMAQREMANLLSGSAPEDLPSLNFHYNYEMPGRQQLVMKSLPNDPALLMRGAMGAEPPSRLLMSVLKGLL